METDKANLEPVLAWDSLRPGTIYPAVRCTLDDRFVGDYLAATGESHPLYAEAGYVPPLSVTFVRFAKEALGGRWPNGTLQITQGLRCHRALRRGEEVEIGLRLGSVEERNGRSYLEMISSIVDAQGNVACEQSMTNLWVPPGSAPPVPRKEISAVEPQPSMEGRLGPRIGSFPLESIRAYAAIAGAHDPVHVDPAYAKTTPLGVNIAQGKLVMTLISQLMLEHFGQRWLEHGTLDLRLRRPVRVDEPVKAYAAPSGEGAFAVWCENGRGECVMEGTAGA